ncbi:hypothetical protein ACIRNI_02580 [Streptomyces sp. NPDC093546]|uniref:hypothetical protein n=1 Tax=Streptomyces sp. NPDC093546 TaxID=3366040 RepID=UPI003803A8F0
MSVDPTRIPQHTDARPGPHAPVVVPVHAKPTAQGPRPDERTLLDDSERDALARRVQHAVNGFVDDPRRAVEEAAGAMEEAAEHLTRALTEQRNRLRTTWDGDGDGGATGPAGAAGMAGTTGAGSPAGTVDTEQLRVTLRTYRDLTDRLLRL